VSNMKKVAVAAIAASALVLASCSDSGDSGNTASGGTSAASSDKSASSKGSSGGASTSASGAAASGAATSSGEAKPAEGASSDAPPLPENVTPPALPTTTHQPVEGGQPASPEDAKSIEGVVRGITAETTLRSYMGYIPQHTCKKVLDENGGEKSLDLGQIPDVPLDSYPDFKKAKPTIDSVTDIKVAGETASAQVTASTEADGQTVATQRFAKENGKWVFCN
jgi:putative lipoprotein